MFIIYGRRNYGRMHEYKDEWLESAFFHVWFAPLAPMNSVWIRRQADGGKVGFKTRFSWPSVLAAYLRIWGLIAGFACLASGCFIGIGMGVGLIALGGLAWLSRWMRSASAQRRSDFNLLAFGSRCDPVLMTDEMRATAQTGLEARHAALPVPRPPDDVARFGPTDIKEAVIAYGLLRLAVVNRRGGADAEASIARLLATAHESSSTGEGPYREADLGAAVSAAAPIHADVAAAAAQVSDHQRRARRKQLPARKSSYVALGLAGGAGAIGALYMLVMIALPPRAATTADFINPPSKLRVVELHCDAVNNLGTVTDRRGKDDTRVWGCELGDRMIVVQTDLDAGELPTQFLATLDWSASDRLPLELTAMPHVYPTAAKLRDPSTVSARRIGALIGCLVIVGGVAGLGVYWTRRRKRAKSQIL